MAEKIIIKGRCEYPGKVRAEALVAPQNHWRGLQTAIPEKAIQQRETTRCFKVPYNGKVMVYPLPRGSGGFMMYGSGPMKPAAFVHTEGCPLSVACAMVARVPSMTDFERDPMEVIETGDMVFVNADEGYIEITKKD